MWSNTFKDICVMLIVCCYLCLGGVLVFELLMSLSIYISSYLYGCFLIWFQFLCLKNIRVFLQACKNVFHLEEKNLFEPYDLFEVKDFGKVSSDIFK